MHGDTIGDILQNLLMLETGKCQDMGTKAQSCGSWAVPVSEKSIFELLINWLVC